MEKIAGKISENQLNLTEKYLRLNKYFRIMDISKDNLSIMKDKIITITLNGLNTKRTQ